MTTPILELDGVVGGYGAMTILNGTSFTVPRAAITTVIGPNGAGKSTVFKAIFGLLKVREGQIRLEGNNITNWSQRKLLEAGICYIPQGRNIFPELSVRHNIELGAVAAGSHITDMPKRIEAALTASRRCGPRPMCRPRRSRADSRSSSRSCAACCSTPSWC